MATKQTLTKTGTATAKTVPAGGPTMPTTVRFKPETSRRLDRLAKRFGLNCADLIRQAVDQKVSEWEKTGVVLVNAK